MVKKYVSNVASQMGIVLSKVQLIKSKSVRSPDTHMLMMSSNGCNVSTIIYQDDLEIIKSGSTCDTLDLRILQVLLRLQHMHEL
jgi:hypothetical protein